MYEKSDLFRTRFFNFRLMQRERDALRWLCEKELIRPSELMRSLIRKEARQAGYELSAPEDGVSYVPVQEGC
jgi:hypothetical protein